jgi:hypothetical protein
MLSMQNHPSRLKMADSFVVEVSLGDIRLKLCSGDDNSFCLKQSAEGIHVDFSCFTGRLCINKNSSSSESASLSQPLSSEKEDSFENVPVAPAPESAQPTDNTDDSSVGSGETVSLGTWQCDDRTIKHETTPATQESSDHTPQSTRISGRRRAFTLPSEFGSSVKMNDSAIWSFQQSVLPARAGSKDDLCCRLKERIESETVDDITSAASEEPTTSDLQGVCALPMVASVRQLQAVLDSNPIAASETDIEGRYPLHILSENEPLLASFLGSKDAEDFCLNLFEAYPEAIIIPDNTGAFPFVHLIKNWVEDSYHRMNQRNTKPRKGLIRTFHSSKGKLNSLFRSDSKYDRTTPETNSKRALFPHVVLTRQVQMSFKILSIYLDRLNESYRQGDFDREANMLVRAAIAESIADIPNVLKTAFLIDDSDKRQWASRCSIIERVCFCTQSTGDWVRNMLKRGGDPSRRAVDYLVQVSGLTVTDYIGPGRSPRLDDTEAYERDRNKVFAALENASPLIPALTVLDSEGKGRAATTDAVWLILNHSLSNPLVVGLLLADFVFSLVLLQTFRYASNSSTQLLYFGGKSSPINNREATTLFLSVCVYFLVRKLSEFYSLLSLSSQAFRSYLANFWNLVDFAAVGMSLSAVLTQTQNAVFLALAMGSLWLKLLGLLRAVNAHLATFILAIQDIVRDIRWFLLVFAIAIFMFADMIHIITIHAQDGNFCKDGEAPSAFCNDVAQVYLKLYAVLMGDVDLEEFAYSSGIEFLFVVFTFMGIIVLLNVLIGKSKDSETCFILVLAGTVFMHLLPLHSYCRRFVQEERDECTIFVWKVRPDCRASFYISAALL